LLTGPTAGGRRGPDRDALPDAIIDLCRHVGVPNGIAAFGYAPADIDALVAGASRQQRLLSISPRDVTERDLADLYAASMTNW
jgi:alcohol dehydrogenase class IV